MAEQVRQNEEYNLYLDETSRVSALDLYEDLLAADDDKVTLLSVSEVNIEKKQLQEQNQLLLQQLSQATANLKSITEQNNALKQNFACLLETAKTELERKNKVIARLSGTPEYQGKSNPRPASAKEPSKNSLSLKGRRVDDHQPRNHERDVGNKTTERLASSKSQPHQNRSGDSGLQLLPEKLVSVKMDKQSHDDRGSLHLKRKSIPEEAPDHKRFKDAAKRTTREDDRRKSREPSRDGDAPARREKQRRGSSHNREQSPQRKARDRTSEKNKESHRRSGERDRSSSGLRHKLTSGSHRKSTERHSDRPLRNRPTEAKNPCKNKEKEVRSSAKHQQDEPVFRDKEPLKRKADSSTDVPSHRSNAHRNAKTRILKVPEVAAKSDIAKRPQNTPSSLNEKEDKPRRGEVKTVSVGEKKTVNLLEVKKSEAVNKHAAKDNTQDTVKADVKKADGMALPDSITSTSDQALFDMPSLDIYDELDFNEDSLVTGMPETCTTTKSPVKSSITTAEVAQRLGTSDVKKVPFAKSKTLPCSKMSPVKSIRKDLRPAKTTVRRIGAKDANTTVKEGGLSYKLSSRVLLDESSSIDNESAEKQHASVAKKPVDKMLPAKKKLSDKENENNLKDRSASAVPHRKEQLSSTKLNTDDHLQAPHKDKIKTTDNEPPQKLASNQSATEVVMKTSLSAVNTRKLENPKSAWKHNPTDREIRIPEKAHETVLLQSSAKTAGSGEEKGGKSDNEKNTATKNVPNISKHLGSGEVLNKRVIQKQTVEVSKPSTNDFEETATDIIPVSQKSSGLTTPKECRKDTEKKTKNDRTLIKNTNYPKFSETASKAPVGHHTNQVGNSKQTIQTNSLKTNKRDPGSNEEPAIAQPSGVNHNNDQALPRSSVGESFMHYYRNASLHCLLHLARKKLHNEKPTPSVSREHTPSKKTTRSQSLEIPQKSREVWLTSLEECQQRRKLRNRWMSERETDEVEPAPEHTEVIPLAATLKPAPVEPSNLSCNSWTRHEESMNRLIGLADFAKIITPIKTTLTDDSNSKGAYTAELHKLQQACRNVFN